MNRNHRYVRLREMDSEFTVDRDRHQYNSSPVNGRVRDSSLTTHNMEAPAGVCCRSQPILTKFPSLKPCLMRHEIL